MANENGVFTDDLPIKAIEKITWYIKNDGRIIIDNISVKLPGRYSNYSTIYVFEIHWNTNVWFLNPTGPMGESNFCWLYTFAFYIPHCIPNFPSPKAITAVKSLGSARAMELFKDLEEPWLVVPLEPGLAKICCIFLWPPSEGRTGEHAFWELHFFEPGAANFGECYFRIDFWRCSIVLRVADNMW